MEHAAVVLHLPGGLSIIGEAEIIKMLAALLRRCAL